MKHAKLNHNKQFMFGIMAMALVVIGVVILFWLWCFPQGTADKPEAKRYAIHLVGFQGDSLQVLYHPERPNDVRLPVQEYWLWGTLLAVGLLSAAGAWLLVRRKAE